MKFEKEDVSGKNKEVLTSLVQVITFFLCAGLTFVADLTHDFPVMTLCAGVAFFCIYRLVKDCKTVLSRVILSLDAVVAAFIQLMMASGTVRHGRFFVMPAWVRPEMTELHWVVAHWITLAVMLIVLIVNWLRPNGKSGKLKN